jgi:hypothetical protein
MYYAKTVLIALAVLCLSSCDYTDFESVWRDPQARPIDLRTEHVAALLLSDNESIRRDFEYNLARQLNRQGVESTPGYELLAESDASEKEEILDALQATSVDHAVFMKIVDRHQEVDYVPGSAWPGSAWYPGTFYDPFFWYGDVFVYEVVSVETLVYSVPESKLVWAGLSKTMNPDDVDDFIEDLVEGAVKHMKKTGFFPGA